jgi:hypothetical protein
MAYPAQHTESRETMTINAMTQTAKPATSSLLETNASSPTYDAIMEEDANSPDVGLSEGLSSSFAHKVYFPSCIPQILTATSSVKRVISGMALQQYKCKEIDCVRTNRKCIVSLLSTKK